MIVSLSSNLVAQTWVALGSGTNDWVTALKEDTANSILYAGGYFTQAGGNSISHIAKWNGTNWTSLGLGVDQGVHALEIINGDLYVGGEFLNAGGISATRIAKYDGVTWTTFGTGLGGSVNGITEYNGEIYAGGFAGLKKWNGSAWINVGSGIGGSNPSVLALKVFNSELYVAGIFGTAGGLTANGLAKWNGSVWSIPGGTGLNNFGTAYALEIFNGELYVGGHFSSVGGVSSTCLAKWNGANWAAVGGGVSGGIFGFDTSINKLKVINNFLYLGGNFDSAGGATANFVALWNGNSFSNLGTGTNERVYSLESFNGDLIAGGQFSQAGGTVVNNISKWIIPSGIEKIDSNNEVIIYPNPSANIFIIAFGRTISKGAIEVLTIIGNKVYETKIFNESEKEIELKSILTGIYFVKVFDGEKSHCKKLIVERD